MINQILQNFLLFHLPAGIWLEHRIYFTFNFPNHGGSETLFITVTIQCNYYNNWVMQITTWGYVLYDVIPSWICPKMWYLGLTRDCIVCKRLRHPALSFETARSPWPIKSKATLWGWENSEHFVWYSKSISYGKIIWLCNTVQSTSKNLHT